MIFIFSCLFCLAQGRTDQEIEVGETMEAYIVENHIEEIEAMLHKLASSKPFIDQFLHEESTHDVNVSSVKRKDIKIGEDIDVSVHHITEHQTFTLILVPISIYNLAIYDTLLFSVIEVSDAWIAREFPYEHTEIDSVKSALLSMKNHELLAHHLYSQALQQSNVDIGKVDIDLTESYISSSTIQEHISHLERGEKDQVRSSWGLLKKAFTHVVDLNVEFNIYVFGFNDLEVACHNKRGNYTVKITPSNIFQRHHFVEKD
ncbi:hypothetical protein BFP72_07285 [Reichenbachiella sp. 5M10]|nr:hypothetical protein BFP72_07285 [Reichenbachiella sp. 5M10]